MDDLTALREAFDNMLVAEVKRHGGIPDTTPEEAALREAVAALLMHTGTRLSSERAQPAMRITCEVCGWSGDGGHCVSCGSNQVQAGEIARLRASIRQEALDHAAHLAVVHQAYETRLATLRAARERLSPDERAHLHMLLQDAQALIDPEAHAALNDAINAVLGPCNHGVCVPMASSAGAACSWGAELATLRAERDRLREALTRAREAIASLPEDALGFGRETVADCYGEPSLNEWPLRDELRDHIDRLLTPPAEPEPQDTP